MAARPKITVMSASLYDYSLSHWLRDTDVKRRLREETAKLPNAMMQIAPDQGQLMALLAQLARAKFAVEVGVFTGYSALCVAEALPVDGKLFAFDINPEWTAIAQRYWREAGVAERIDLRLGPARASLDALLAEGWAGRLDLAFIDADKTGYDTYFERCLTLLRPGGLVMIDNVLWGGAVADASDQDADTQALRALNSKLHHDPRISLALMPIGDGVTVALKR